MSWLDLKGADLARLRTLLVLLPALMLAGCLHPLYGTSVAGGGQLADEMKRIEVLPINNRIGHYLQNELIFNLNGTGSHETPKYKLAIATYEGVSTPLVDTVTGLVTSATVQTTAVYTLTLIDTGKTIAHGRTFVAASYDRTAQRFSDMRASRDAEQRDARILADQIRTQIAAALSTGS